MTPERIEQIRSTPIDHFAPDAAEQLAWHWTAQQCWAARRLDDDPEDDRATFEEVLPRARAEMAERLTRMAKMALAERLHGDELEQLRARKRALQHKPLHIPIRREEQAIEGEIRRIVESIDLAETLDSAKGLTG